MCFITMIGWAIAKCLGDNYISSKTSLCTFIIGIVDESEKYTEADYKDLCKKLRCISKIKSKYRRLYKLDISPLYKTIKLEKVFITNEAREAFRNEILTQKIDMFRKAVDEAIDEIKVKDKELIRILSKI